MSRRAAIGALCAVGVVLGCVEAANGARVGIFGLLAVVAVALAVCLVPLDDPSDR